MNKTFRKIISLILVLIILSNTSFVFANKNNSSCSISSTPEYIIEYIKNIRKVISNISKYTREKKKKQEKSIY
jgi:hypothetical protein